MNILVLGNGFDLAHDLPTKYKDFLDFCNQVVEFYNIDDKTKRNQFINSLKYCSYINEKIKVFLKKYLTENIDKYIKKSDSNKIVFDDKFEELFYCADSNMWIKYFTSCKKLKKNWIDFESEISKVIQAFDSIRKIIHDGKSLNLETPYADRTIVEHFFENIEKEMKDFLKNIFKLDEFIDNLNYDLTMLIRALEIYIGEFINNMPINIISEDIYNINTKYVLSFNYSNTYEKIYGKNNGRISYDYIHGKANSNRKKDDCNLVLGIDEYLPEERINKDIEFIMFKKYYQRICKRTGCEYKKWIESLKKSNKDKKSKEENHIFFFGHSLDNTDGDIIRDLVNISKSKITIFYYNEYAYSQQIANLVKVLGQDALISMVYGSSPKITFIKQKDMIKFNDSKLQLKRDIQSLYNLYLLNDEEIKELFERIKNNIEKENIDYFGCQENVISLYDVLITSDNIDLNINIYTDHIINIAYKINEVTIHNANNWREYFSDGIGECNIKTQKLIEAINNHNKARQSITLEYMDINECNLNELFQCIETSHISPEKFENIFDSIFNKLKTTDNSKLLWKCIFELLKKMPLSERKNFIENRLKNSHTNEKIRYKHIMYEIDEEEYYINQLQSNM